MFKKSSVPQRGMVQRKGGIRRKTRKLLSKHFRRKGKINFTQYLSTLNMGDKVCLVQEPAVHKGQFHTRFYGKAGVVTEQRGSCYAVKFRDGGKEKTIITHPIHLKRIA